MYLKHTSHKIQTRRNVSAKKCGATVVETTGGLGGGQSAPR